LPKTDKLIVLVHQSQIQPNGSLKNANGKTKTCLKACLSNEQRDYSTEMKTTDSPGKRVFSVQRANKFESIAIAEMVSPSMSWVYDNEGLNLMPGFEFVTLQTDRGSYCL